MISQLHQTFAFVAADMRYAIGLIFLKEKKPYLCLPARGQSDADLREEFFAYIEECRGPQKREDLLYAQDGCLVVMLRPCDTQLFSGFMGFALMPCSPIDWRDDVLNFKNRTSVAAFLPPEDRQVMPAGEVLPFRPQ